MNKPQDFDQYWKKVEDELASIQPAAERTKLHLRSAPEAKVYGLKLTSLDPVPCHLQIAELRKCCSHPSFRRTMQIRFSSIVPPWTTSFGSAVCSKISGTAHFWNRFKTKLYLPQHRCRLSKSHGLSSYL